MYLRAKYNVDWALEHIFSWSPCLKWAGAVAWLEVRCVDLGAALLGREVWLCHAFAKVLGKTISLCLTFLICYRAAQMSELMLVSVRCWECNRHKSFMLKSDRWRDREQELPPTESLSNRSQEPGLDPSVKPRTRNSVQKLSLLRGQESHQVLHHWCFPGSVLVGIWGW